MQVGPDTPHRTVLRGRTHLFCSAGCKARFDFDQNRYLGKTSARVQHALEGAAWTCPIHPEVRENEAKSCPFCGMALEPMTMTADSEPSPELLDMTGRL